MRRICATVCLLALGACGSAPGWQAPPADEYLLTRIADDDTKFFVFQRDYLPLDGSAALNARNNQRGARRPGPVYAERHMEERLTAIMERTGYCREGFFELYREQSFSGLAVHGECREGATEEDRLLFSDESIVLN